MGIKSFITNLISKKKENEASRACELPAPCYKHYTRDELLKLIDLNTVKTIEQTNTGKKKLLIVDDISETTYILKTTANENKRKHGVNFYEDFDVTFITTEMCGVTAYKHVINPTVKYDYVMLDLSIGTRLNIPNADILELDGIDLYDIILKLNPNAKIVFFTAHTLDKDDKRMRYYYEKCSNLLHKDIESISIPKGEERIEMIYNFLYQSAQSCTTE